MLAVLAVIMIATFMFLIMTNRMTAMIALILVPAVFAALSGHATEIGRFMLDGVSGLAPTGVMLIFAILYFGLMIDVGLFNPLVNFVVRLVHGDPVRILVGTAILALTISLDGDGATTYMITTGALIPLYRHMGMDLKKMACIIIMSGAVMNILPWGGPTARVMSVLGLGVTDLFLPLVPSMIVTALWVVAVAWLMGVSERNRLELSAALPADSARILTGIHQVESHDNTQQRASSNRLQAFNLILTLLLMVMLISEVMPTPILFMIAFSIALMVNAPKLSDQRTLISNHAANALFVAGMIFAAGAFTGILSGTGMAEAMSTTVIDVVPQEMGRHIAIFTAIISIPFTFFISNDAFYFGVLPVMAEVATQYGVGKEEIGRASLVGQQLHLLSPLVPSTYLLVGLAGIELSDLIRISIKWAFGSCFFFLAVSLVTGAFPWAA